MRLLFVMILTLAVTPAGVRAADAADEAARSYRIATTGSTQNLRVGQKGQLSLAIEPVGEKIHVNAKAPLRIKLTASAGLKLEKEQLTHADEQQVGAAVRFSAPFVAVAAGKQEARAKLEFFICSESWCVKQSRSAVIPVEVKK